MAKHSRHLSSFSIVELLVVIAIIAILFGLLLAALSGVMRTGGRDRARGEIKAMESALEAFKSDNGAYPVPPVGTGFTSTNDYNGYSPSIAGPYQDSSAFLFQQLTGRTNYSSYAVTTNAATGQVQTVYYPFKPAQLGNDTPGASGNIYIQDPFGNSYGYFAGSGVNVPCNGTNQFDIWSTAGDTNNPPTNKPSWINNWGG